jgi:hypothetical protein
LTTCGIFSQARRAERTAFFARKLGPAGRR